ncbi:hypothetical protein AXX17_AT4G13800 [Arabidopsis thaliana]|uniref:Uncharacterized protein n=1 Tax=Arabidopsis thaliana TaxID=3702 RepID=A0A178V0F7_ARATH|nr:hypothetical protein AXX17_AT4G13800 [Arabidopsis thaliana]
MEFAKMCFEKLYGVDTSEAKEMYNSVYDVMKAMLKEYTVIFKGPNTQSSQSNPPSSTAARDTFACELAEDSNVEFERMDRRICAGIALAERMILYTLATLLHSFDWTIPDGHVLDLEEKFGIVLKLKTPLVALPIPRLSNSNFYF